MYKGDDVKLIPSEDIHVLFFIAHRLKTCKWTTITQDVSKIKYWNQSYGYHNVCISDEFKYVYSSLGRVHYIPTKDNRFGVELPHLIHYVLTNDGAVENCYNIEFNVLLKIIMAELYFFSASRGSELSAKKKNKLIMDDITFVDFITKTEY